MNRKVKSKKPKVKSFVILISFVICTLCFVIGVANAKEIAIIYSGQTHAMIYPCSCPFDPEGGVARRATVVKQIRKEYPDNLLLDSGDFFAGGLMDEYTQNTQLDIQRSLVNLRAMELMKYDAAAIGDDEFNFGSKILRENIAKTKLTFLSCNLKSDKVSSSMIKEVSGVKIGIIAVTTVLAKQKSDDLEFNDPKSAVYTAVENLHKQNVNIIIVLSHLAENESLNLINDVGGIDILIEGHSAANNKEPSTKIGNTLVLRPSWEGKSLQALILSVEGDKIKTYKLRESKLSNAVADDPQIISILPKCFSDNNCKKEGFVGLCKDPGDLKSRCIFNKANQVKLLIVTPKDCLVCETAPISDFLKRQFPGLSISYMYYPDKRVNSLIKDFNVTGLPAYFLGKEVEMEGNFNALKGNLTLKGQYYMVAPYFSGFSYFLNRQKQKGKLDLFLSLFDKATPQLLTVIKEFNPQIHFLAIEESGKFDAASGRREVEEDMRAVCVQQYYPKHFWDYISCRSNNIDSSWWEDCAQGIDLSKIFTCARGNEGYSLLKANTAITKEAHIMMGPAYLLDNLEIFSSRGAPSKDELKKIIKR